MSGRVRVIVVGICLVLVAAVVAGCGSTKTSSATTESTATAGVLDGATLVDSLCTKCHPRARIDQASKDLAGWQSTINRMVSQHQAKVTPEQQSAIAIYLSGR